MATIPLSSRPLPVKYELYATSRNVQAATRILEIKLRLPLPKPRTERLIVQRDKLGRIVHSKSPALFKN